MEFLKSHILKVAVFGLFVCLISLIACSPYDNPYDPINSSDDFDADGTPNGIDTNPKDPNIPKKDNPIDDVEVLDDKSVALMFKFLQFEISGMPENSNLISCFFRESNDQMYLLDEGTIQFHLIDLSGEEPAGKPSIDIFWPPVKTDTVGVWNGDTFYRISSAGNFITLNESMQEQSSQALSSWTTESSGSVIYDGSLITMKKTDEVIDVWGIDVADMTQNKLMTLDIELLREKTASTAHYMHTNGLGIDSNGLYWLLASEDPSRSDAKVYIVQLKSDGAPKFIYEISSLGNEGEIFRYITSDGENLWILTNNRLWKLVKS